MKIIKINKEGFVASSIINDATTDVEISDEEFVKLFSRKLNYNWRYIDGKLEQVPIMSDEVLRNRREEECFTYINRGELWYSLLTDSQKDELKKWYQNWLDVTKTKIIPNKPEWL